MLPNLSSLSSLTIAPDGPCRPCGSRRTAATGTKYGDPGWEMEPCGICTYPLGQDSSINPWAPNPQPYAGPCCVNDHAYHKGCIRQWVNTNRNENRDASCPTCRSPILPDFLDVPPPPGTFASSVALKAAVQELLALDPTGATPHPVHGPIGGWNVSRVENMRYLFHDATYFNQPLNGWNVSNVENMASMFSKATSFNQPLNGWDVRKVQDMFGMFYGATSFNQPLDSWDVRKVKDMLYMFQDATSFNQDLCDWNLRADAYTGGMFDGATAFNSDPTTRPPNCPGVFFGNTPLQKAVDELLALDPTGATPHPVHGPIGGWDVSRVNDMRNVFSGATSFNQPLNGWNVSNVKRMTYMFSGATSFNQPLDGWVVSNVKNMEFMFLGARSFNQPLNGWDVSDVMRMSMMFFNAISFNQDLCSWILRDDATTVRMFDGADAFNRDPATRPPRRRSEAEAGGDCPSLPRGLTRQRSEREGSPAARQRTGAAAM